MDEFIRSSPMMLAFASLPQLWLYMILMGALVTLIDVRWTAFVLIIMTMVALAYQARPANAYEYGARAPYAYAKRHYPRGRDVGQLGGYNPFSSSYEHRSARMSREYDEPRTMYNGGYRDTRSRFQP